ncbi:MAG TPA: gliding motility-associated C-terminal domain-containing protein [Ferruginibacter sp.]|nr:gliding motility-associated C-terminal domain-containing protein [Ferruginibacter sp.]
MKDYLFTVFNRYGEKVFETRDYAKRWDGRYKGKEQSAGTYTYRIRFMTDAGWEFTDTGTVVLIR